MPLANTRLKPRLPTAWLSFDGVDDYVQVADSPSLNISDEITITLWILWYYEESADLLLTKRDTNWRNGYEIEVYNGELRFLRSNATDVERLSSGLYLEVGEWNCIACVYDGTNMKVYLNTQSKSKVATIASIDPSGHPLIIGTSPMKTQPYFVNGRYGEIRVYNRALSESEIQQLYYWRGGAITDGLVLWLSEESINPPAWNDQSGYGNNGTIYGAQKTDRPLTALHVYSSERLLAAVR